MIPPLAPEPVVPAGYRKIAPASVDDARQMLAQTATIFRGSLTSVQFTYDDCGGPRTTYVFSDSSTLAGERVESTVALKLFGGPTPGGKWLDVSELPKLALDSQYVVFLRNTDWTYSPIVGNLVFRVETIAGKEVLVHPGGHAIVGWGSDGPILSAAAVSEVVGNKRHGYRTADTPSADNRSASGIPDAKGAMRAMNGGETVTAPARDSLLTRAPSLAEARKAALFARPARTTAAIDTEAALSLDALLVATRAAAEREHLKIGGRVTLDPHWKCWSFTPTAMAAAR